VARLVDDSAPGSGRGFRLADSRIERLANPEHAIFAAWAASQVIITASVAMTGGPNVPTMSWFAIPIVTLAARFSTRGIALGVAITLGLMAAVAFGVDAHAVIHDPPKLIAPVALVIAVTIFSIALMRSDVHHRTEAVIDPLTGMLNRKALDVRTEELEQQSRFTGEPIGVVVGDIDNFKQVNDRFGHARGDAALREVAYHCASGCGRSTSPTGSAARSSWSFFRGQSSMSRPRSPSNSAPQSTAAT
jgi:GGDEF domain-containing protein